MNISRFFGSTNREALRQVRIALGQNALIVSNRRVNGGVEILASDQTLLPEGDVAVHAAAAAPAAPAGLAHAPILHDTHPEAAPVPDIMGAIGAMRGEIETRIDELLWGSQLKRVPQTISLFQALLKLGFSTVLLRAMLKRLPEQLSSRAAFQWARNELVTHLPVMASQDEFWTPGLVLALVGPTGAGKTTTLAKLAALCVKRFGADKVVLLTTDTYRVGAFEQLKLYGEMMRIPVRVIHDADELSRAVSGIGGNQIILIDNAGISQRDQYVHRQSALLAAAGRPVKRILVLNASSHGDTLDEVARTYCADGGSPIAGCIITKIDEASCLGAALDTAIRYQLPIDYVSNGQKVPEDLLFLPAAELVDRALSYQPQARSLFAPSEADVAALLPGGRSAVAQAPALADTRRRQLLPGLLASGQAGIALSSSSWNHVFTYIDDDFACSQAYDIWRAQAAPSIAMASKSQLFGAVHQELVGSGCRYVLAAHHRVSPGPASAAAFGPCRDLYAALLLTEHARMLVTPLQKPILDDGRHCPGVKPISRAQARKTALLYQIKNLGGHDAPWPLVHLFDAPGQAVWRSLSAQDVLWLAAAGAGTKVETESGKTTLGALSKTLEFHVLARQPLLLPLSQAQGYAMDDIVLWVGSATVDLSLRQADPLALHMIAVRVVNRKTGLLIKTLYGLSNLLPAMVEGNTLAAWLVAYLEAKTCFRHVGTIWPMLISHERPDALQRKACAAVQLAMAAWRITQDPQAAQVRAVVQQLAGKPLPASSAALAILKLFALKEMMA